MLYTNRNSHRDFVENAITQLASKSANVYIAVAFFTEPEVVEKLVERGCRVRLVVRLGFPTQADALERAMSHSGVEIRYFTDTAFHPKLYLFGNVGALVGSANLTRAAITSNQEVVVALDTADERLNELALLFAEYWARAKVLTKETIATYRSICSKYGPISAQSHSLDQEVLNRLGRTFAGDVIADKVEQSKDTIFVEDFRRTYQECVGAFNTIRRVYERAGKRKVQADLIPLRIEIDSFISFLRERYATGEVWKTAPIRALGEQEAMIAPLVLDWLQTPWPHFETTIVGTNYPRLVNVFGKRETILSASDDHLFDALATAHSFHDRLRFFDGGLPTWKAVFLKANDPSRLRQSLAYLVHGSGATEQRMANLIFSPAYKLSEFGPANVEELIGWCNYEELPIINGRTTKVFRWLGFDVTQLGA